MRADLPGVNRQGHRDHRREGRAQPCAARAISSRRATTATIRAVERVSGKFVRTFTLPENVADRRDQGEVQGRRARADDPQDRQGRAAPDRSPGGVMGSAGCKGRCHSTPAPSSSVRQTAMSARAFAARRSSMRISLLACVCFCALGALAASPAPRRRFQPPAARPTRPGRRRSESPRRSAS